MKSMDWLAIGLGAAIGACLRAWLARFNDTHKAVGQSSPLSRLPERLLEWLPLGTLMANVLGGLLIGVALVVFGQMSQSMSVYLRPLVITGFLGGLTTFSTFSAEVFVLINEGRVFNGLCLVVLHVLLTLVATAVGFYASKWLLW